MRGPLLAVVVGSLLLAGCAGSPDRAPPEPAPPAEAPAAAATPPEEGNTSAPPQQQQQQQQQQQVAAPVQVGGESYVDAALGSPGCPLTPTQPCVIGAWIFADLDLPPGAPTSALAEVVWEPTIPAASEGRAVIFGKSGEPLATAEGSSPLRFELPADQLEGPASLGAILLPVTGGAFAAQKGAFTITLQYAQVASAPDEAAPAPVDGSHAHAPALPLDDPSRRSDKDVLAP